jgi:hypothetical protein
MRRIAKRSVLIALCAALIVGLLLEFTRMGSPVVRLNFSANTQGLSQIFFNNGGSYSEENSKTYRLATGITNLSFKIQGDSPVRWDPSQTEASIILERPYITLFRVKLDTPVKINALNQIQSIQENGGRIIIESTERANDPQVQISFDTRAIAKEKLNLVLAISALVALTTALVSLFTSQLSSISKYLDRVRHHAHEHVRAERFTLNEFFILSGMAITANIYFIANLSLSIDDEMGAARSNPEVWISQGRWAVYFIESFLFPQPAIPFAPYILLSVCIAGSYMLLIRSHGHMPSWKSYFTFPVIAGYPTLWLISEFSSNVPALAIGFFLTTLSAYLVFIKHPTPPKVYSTHANLLVVPLLLAFSIACYQSLAILFVSICLGINMIKIVSNTNNWKSATNAIITDGTKALIYLGLGILLYAIINKASQHLANSFSPYLNSFIKLETLINSPLSVITSVIAEANKFYIGSASRFGAAIPISLGLLIISALSILSQVRGRATPALLIFTLLLASPFALHFLAGPDNVPLRTMIALGYATWLMAFIALTAKNPIITLLSVLIIGTYQIQSAGVTSQYIASAKLTQGHDEALASSIYQAIIQTSGNETASQHTPIVIDVYGHKPFETLYAKALTSTTQASFFDWDNGNLLRITTYMRLLGFNNILPADEKTRQTLTPYFSGMPTWPLPGSIINVNGTYLIKLSEDADPAHLPTK